ncbi:DUF2339 domain-containing protein [Thalassotalea ponticola]|uniref:DUF2339 domain-containing protein n=1 Tax=Thalassotalea ponticola TaxID=1523392 RepID=UPI0025B5E8BE|nr:DUF2339 domain-containing protein [Thalassotalea ponticola]MDN3651214.1 DUF2339 domain-containing protein [Thalassotalea ponticola]
MNQEVKALKSELALLKLQFNERLSSVETRLNKLLEDENPKQNEHSLSFIDVDSNSAVQLQNEALKTEAQLPESADEYRALNRRPEDSVARQPSFFTSFLQIVLSSLFDWFSPVTKVYQSYKERGLLGIFVLTLAGIGLTLAGFGYLMQLLIDQLGAGTKSLLMCMAAILVMAVGIRLKINTRFSEFATAIVTLGILLSYSTIYFSGSVYGIIPNIVVLLLYLLIALVCHFLAIWLDTKIVAGLGIIGIATMPILSNTIQIEPLYFLLSLAFVTASSLILAYKKSEPWLANLSLAFCVVALEWTIGIEAVSISAWIVNLFYLLFFTYIVITLVRNDDSNHKAIALLAALVGATLLFFFQASELFSTQMSASFALNAVIAASVSILFYKIRHNLTHFVVLLSSVWTVLAIISAISDAYWGIAWAVEGLLLLYIGRRYEMTKVINQGQALTALALVYCWSALALYFPLPALKSVDGWVLSIVIVAVIGIWQRLVNASDVFDQLTQNKIKPLLQLLEVVWLSVLAVATLDIWLGNWTGATVILLQLLWLFRAKQCKQVSIEVFAAALISVPLFYAFSGALMVDSYRFMTLPLFAKLAVISAFIQLWLWSAFYRKYQPDSAIKGFAESARILFYMLLPLCWVGSTIRRLDENALMLLWLSPLLSLYLATKTKHQLLIKETKVLAALASLALVVIVGQMELAYSLVALMGFITFYGTAFYFNKRISKSQLCQFICSCGVISLGLAVPTIIGVHSTNILIGLVAASLIWVGLLAMLGHSEHLKRNEYTIICVNGILIVTAWWLTASDAMYASIPLIFLLVAAYRNSTFISNTKISSLLGLNSNLFLHSIAAVTYVTLFASLNEYRLDLLIAPVFAVHGAVILFVNDRRLFTVKYSFGLIVLGIIKLAFIDTANALLWQKVILFMGIGVFILMASFWYQKLVRKAV